MPSTLQLALAATVAVHLIAAVVVDAVGVTSKSRPKPPPPRISMVDIDVAQLRPPPAPPPPPVPTPDAPDLPAPPPPANPRTRIARTATAAPTTTSTDTPEVDAPPRAPTTPATTPGGGDAPVYQLPDQGAGGAGPAMAIGRPPSGPTGGGGSGGGTGGGDGAGTGSGTALAPVSIASIKTPAKPTGAYDYFDAGKNYPAEARAQGVEGTIKAKLTVDASGRVTKVRLLSRLGHGLDQVALARAQQLIFEPARDADDRAVASIVVWEFNFTLPP